MGEAGRAVYERGLLVLATAPGGHPAGCGGASAMFPVPLAVAASLRARACCASVEALRYEAGSGGEIRWATRRLR